MNRKLDLDGFAVVPAVLGSKLVNDIGQSLAEHLPSGAAGIRALAAKVPYVNELSRSLLIRALVEPILGPDAQLVRSVLFAKSEEANWHVAWHQDLAIAVQNRVEVDGFVSWSSKEGVLHVQPPIQFLERMLTLRLHLDAADETNGALWVSPGSHHSGRLPAGEAASIAEQRGKQLCAVNAGDAMLMRPLLLHASRKTSSNRPRRVIHLEFSGALLPVPLLWAREAA